ncbi:MAG TPA: DUF3891 family protein, partial [Opitutaceae bacterium]
VHWGNAVFPPPEPRTDVLTAVARHDDAWATRDAVPFLTREGRPSAFSRELVGRYSAFEEIDFADYLAVRGKAAEVVAADNPYAAIIISMHTVSLLTTQADLSSLRASDLELHRAFIENQKRRQGEWIASLAGDPARAEAVKPDSLLRAFAFLQACDSLSLGVCVRYPSEKNLRHAHPRRDGSMTEITCTPLGDDTYRLAPYPLDRDTLVLELPCRTVPGKTFPNQEYFRSAYAAAPVVHLKVRIVR